MKKNKVLIMVICILIIILCIANNKFRVVFKNIINKKQSTVETISNKNMYTIANSSYINKDIRISYPQLEGLGDIDKEKKINLLIRNEAIKVLNYYDSDTNGLLLDINYAIKLKSKKLLSIQYIGSGYTENKPHPDNIFYTLNLDINKGTKVKLKDIVSIDKNFIKMFKAGEYKPFDNQLKVENESKEEVSLNTDKDLIASFNKADEISNENDLKVFSYFTKDSLGISIDVSHSIGDHAEFEIKYNKLPSFKKIKI